MKKLTIVVVLVSVVIFKGEHHLNVERIRQVCNAISPQEGLGNCMVLQKEDLADTLRCLV